MLNLILTPVYNAFDRVVETCEAIDKHSAYPFIHILIDDNSDGKLPISVTENRRIITIGSDIPIRVHKNQLGQAVQLGYDYAHQAFMNEIPNPHYDHIFLIESDVVVQDEWDKKQIDLIPSLPSGWATLDVQSIDTKGNLTYPTVNSPRYGFINDDLEHMHYADFQCTLFNPEVFKVGVKFSDFASHFDIQWSRKITELTGGQHFRTKTISAIHYASSSRDIMVQKAREKGEG